MKIVYCSHSICHVGGMERILIAKANALAALEGNEVWIAVTDNKKPPVLPIDERVHVADLDINYFENDWKSKFYVIKDIIVKRRLHRQRLKKLLDDIQPNIVISQGRSEKNFLPKLKIASNPVFIREIHSTSNYRWMAANGMIDKMMAWLGDLYDYRYSIKRYDRIVLLTHEDKERYWKDNDKAIVIPNPITIRHNERSNLRNNKVISLGRLSKEKNYASLIHSWVMVHSLHPDWILEIWGEGELKSELQKQIGGLGLQDSAFLKGYTNDVISQLVSSSIFVLSSLYEGFGLVITEAMSCGLPVVSYACPCGPTDIITESKDGFLVSIGDEQTMAERIIYLIEHLDSRLTMGREALYKSKQYSIDNIIRKWIVLFNDLLQDDTERTY